MCWKFGRMFFWKLLVLCKVFVVWTQRVPEQFLQSPCPGIFEYRYDDTGNLVGNIYILVPGIGNDRIVLDLQMSVGNPVQGFNGHITVATPSTEVIPDILNQKPIRYTILFPLWRKYPPRVTKIAVNGAQICYGNPIEKYLVNHLTTITLQHTLTVNIPPEMKGTFNRQQFLAASPSSNQQTEINPYGFLNQNQGWNSFVNAEQNNNNCNNQNQFVFYYDGNGNYKKKQDGCNNGGAFLNIGNVTPGGFNQNPFFNNNNNNNGGVNSFLNNQGGTYSPNTFNSNGGTNPFVNIFGNSNRSNNGGTNPFINIFGNSNQKNPGFDAKIPPSNTTNRTDNGGTNPGNSNRFDTKVGGETTTKKSVDDTCGVTFKINTLILGGNDIEAGDLPWLGALFRQENEGLRFSCGSTLVTKKHVITAAHCIQTSTKKYTPAELWVVLGRTNIKQWSYHDGAQIIQVESTHIHPDYRYTSADADLGVVTLGEEAIFSNLIRPACVWSGATSLKAIVGKNGIVVGWGKDESGSNTLTAPKRISLPVVSEEDCLWSNSAFGILTSNRTFCAGYKNNSGPCNGDSGGGFFINVTGKMTLRGIVSLSLVDEHKNCNLKEYTMFTDVAQHLQWLWSILR